MRLLSVGPLEHFSTYWCEQESSAAQSVKEINYAARSNLLKLEQGMDDSL